MVVKDLFFQVFNIRIPEKFLVIVNNPLIGERSFLWNDNQVKNATKIAQNLVKYCVYARHTKFVLTLYKGILDTYDIVVRRTGRNLLEPTPSNAG
jgi:hypothetical protein